MLDESQTSHAQDAPIILRLRAGALAGTLALCGVLAVGMPIGAWFVCRQPDAHAQWLIWSLSIGLSLVGVLGAASALAERTILAPGHVEQRGLFQRQRLEVADISGYRLVETGQWTSFIRLIPRRKGLPRIRIMARHFNGDPAAVDWLSRFEDLDVADYEAAQAALDRDAAFGASAPERSRRIAMVSRVCNWLNLAGIAIALWAMFLPRPYLAAVLAAAACPILAVLAATIRPDWFRLDEEANSPRPNLSSLAWMPALALGLRGLLDVDVDDLWIGMGAAAGAGVLTAAVVTALTTRGQKPAPKAWLKSWVPSAFVAAFYAFGVIVLADSMFDRTRPMATSQLITAMRISSGKQRTYDLTLAPWSAAHGDEDVHVSPDFYGSVRVGQSVCLYAFPGALGLPWHEVGYCPDATPAKR